MPPRRAQVVRSRSLATPPRIDPTFAPAYMGLASAYDELGLVFVGAISPGSARKQWINAAPKALELDPDIPDARAQLAFVYVLRTADLVLARVAGAYG